MALLSNSGSIQIQKTANGSSSPAQCDAPPNNKDHFLFSNLFNNLPRWDTIKTGTGPVNVPQNNFAREKSNDEFDVGTTLGAIGSGPSTSSILHNDLLGGITLTPSTSPQTSSSTSSQCISLSVYSATSCGRCDINATNRCLDCNDIYCDDCLNKHNRNLQFSRDHCVVMLNNLSPIGSSINITNTSNEPRWDSQCDSHGEILRYVCETCKKIVCQECTLWDHKDHVCLLVDDAAENIKEKIVRLIETGKIGNKYIKSSIDRAVQCSQTIERDAMEVSSRIRKALRQYITTVEEREQYLCEKIDKYRQQKLSSLSDQMTGLRSALAGLSQTSELLSKTLESAHIKSNLELVQVLTRAESQLDHYAAIYKNLQPKEEYFTFVQPNLELIGDLRVQGDVIMSAQRNATTVSPPNSANGNILIRRPLVRSSSVIQPSRAIPSWDQTIPINVASSNNSSNSLIGNGQINGNIGQCIPGYTKVVTAKPGLCPTLTFAFDGHEDGLVSRPWGLCVDRDGNIIVADRRNNRIQIFYSDGAFKFKFGCKGNGNGQFDLPAGISTDPQNRILVVDKDNHRVQIFTSNGIYILKFGSYGKDCGQFQYPWDIAVNSKGEMLVTDSRNHRIQLFSPDGHFISRFGFDGMNHNRSLKGLTTPRGVCFTPSGDIIISDFENHRLLLIDSGLSKIISTKGHEGTGVQEFCRPSGLCCDDEGRVIVADSKNQRVLIFSHQLEFLWTVDIRPSSYPPMPNTIDEKDRPSDVALLPDGRLVVMVETSPDARDVCNPNKTFIQIF